MGNTYVGLAATRPPQLIGNVIVMTTDDDVAPVRWGIAGTGGIASSMTEALGTLPDAEVVAVGSRHAATAENFASRYGIPRAHGSYQALFEDSGIDIVYIASPHSRHHDMTIAALRAGRHVLCEKAFAVNTSQAREMIDTARSENRFLMEAMWSWFMPAWRVLRERIDGGAIGEVRLVEASFGLPILDEDGRLRRADLTGGALLDLGIYPLALARYLLGEPSEVRALGTLTSEGVDAVTAGVLSFPSGAIASFGTTMDGRTDHHARIVGTEGSITVDAPFWHPDGLVISRAGEAEVERIDRPNQGLAHEAAHAMDQIRAGRVESDVVTWADTLANMELMDEIRRQIGVVYPEER